MIWAWLIFLGFVFAMLALDLGVFHRKSHVVGFKESLGWSAVWITLGLSFSVLVYFAYDLHWFDLGHSVDAVDKVVNTGKLAATKYLTAYVVEKSLSVDNVFVFALLFSYFAVPAQYQHKVLFWGIIGALIMRAVMIALGAKLITEFAWIIYVFGVFLIVTGIKMIVKRETEIHPENNPLVKLFKRFMPVTPEFQGEKFFIRKEGILMATPLFVVLLLVEFTDLIFAVDSIPAIFAVTKDPFIVYTSNVFAILGLRSLYFALAGVMDKFHYLKVGLGVVLSFVGVKMLLGHTEWKIDTHLSLGVIVMVLTRMLWNVLHSPAS
jgi:tellurite resistance protein TerC